MSGITITSVYPILSADIVYDNVDDIPRATVINDREDDDNESGSDHSNSSWESVKRYSLLALHYLYQKSRNLIGVLVVCAMIFVTRKMRMLRTQDKGLGLYWKPSATDLRGEKFDDYFGAAISLSNDGNFVTVMSVSVKYMYSLSENGTTWTKVGKNLDKLCNISEKPSPDHEFGYDLVTSSDGKRVVVGYAFDTFGSAILATLNEETQEWKIAFNFTGENSTDGFGSVIGISNDGQKIVVAPVLERYISIYKEYGNNASQWNKTIFYLEEDEILRSTKTRFMDLSGDGKRIAVGSLSGVKVLHEDDQGNWVQLGQRIYGDSIGNGFGECVTLSLDGNILAVGAPGITFGYVDIFKYSAKDNKWKRFGNRILGKAEGGDRIGFSLSISSDGHRLATGAFGGGPRQKVGYVGIFEYAQDTQTWMQIGEYIDGESPGDWFGYRVKLSSNGNRVGASAILAKGNEHANAGVVRFFDVVPIN